MLSHDIYKRQIVLRRTAVDNTGQAMRRWPFLVTCVAAGLFVGAALYIWQQADSSLSPIAATRNVTTMTQAASVTDHADLLTISTEPHRPHSYHDGIMRVAPSVVSLYSSSSRVADSSSAKATDGAPDNKETSGIQQINTQGSGVIVGEDGIVLTNLHLVEDADTISVVLGDGTVHPAQLVGSDRETDLAVVRIEARNLPAVPFDTAPFLKVGDIVLAIGNPFGVGQTVTQGIVSATRRRVAGGSAWQNFVQIDAAINPGNSGGALINPDGQLVGINTAVFRRENGAEGISFAIPADQLAQVVPQIIAKGRVERGWLGVGAEDVAMFPAVQRQVGQGAVITSVIPDSPAARAGLQRNDIVLAVDEKVIDNAAGFLLSVSALPPESRIVISLVRDSAETELPVVLGDRPDYDQVPR